MKKIKTKQDNIKFNEKENSIEIYGISMHGIYNVYYSRLSGKYTSKKSDNVDPSAIASATYINSYETKGWDFLTISSYELDDKAYSDSNKAYAMGYVEGIVNWEKIYQIYRNLLYFTFYEDDYKIPDNLKEFMAENLEYLKSSLDYYEDDLISARHGGWIDPIDEYIETFDFSAVVSVSQKIFCSGHTHVQKKQIN
jgi:hypothetical protein